MNNTPREKLRYIIRQYGRTICDDPRRCEALLRDFCPEYKREINLLVGALRERVAAELMNGSGSVPKELLFAKLVKRLYENMGFAEEFCHWAVESWALALGVPFEIPPVPPLQKGGDASPPLQKGDSGGFSVKTPKYRLRSQPITVSDGDFRKVFKLNKDRRSPLQYIKNIYRDNGNGTISDHATGLMWQKSGSDNYLELKDVPNYIYELKHKRFAGYDDWRMPTIDELASLVKPKKQSNNLYINPIFDKKQWWCWSADIRASGWACHIYFDSGGICCYILDVSYVRAVRLLLNLTV